MLPKETARLRILESFRQRAKEASYRHGKINPGFKQSFFFVLSRIKMTTATTLGDAVFSLNMTRGEDFLYKSKVHLGQGCQGKLRGQLTTPPARQPRSCSLPWASVSSPVRWGLSHRRFVVKTQMSHGKGSVPVDVHTKCPASPVTSVVTSDCCSHSLLPSNKSWGLGNLFQDIEIGLLEK